MKNLYRKGKVHPSPAQKDAYSVLKLLPVAIATLSAALPPEDQEVLAYLIARSQDVLPLQETETKHNKKPLPGRKCSSSSNNHGSNKVSGFDSEDEEPPPWTPSSSPFGRFVETDALLRRSASGRAASQKDLKNKRKASQQQQQILRSHRPSFECNCFHCYTSFWSRWDASPSRQTIHEAIDLFEEHMAAAAAAAATEAVKGKGKNRKGSKPGKDEKNADKASVLVPYSDDKTIPAACKKEEEEENVKIGEADKESKNGASVVVWEEDSNPAPKSKQIVPFVFEEDDVARPGRKVSEQPRAGACPLGGRSLMRRMFPDIMGFVADHLWTAWSSPDRAANA
eukprot:Gb_06518 [translate_table: standard]